MNEKMLVLVSAAVALVVIAGIAVAGALDVGPWADPAVETVPARDLGPVIAEVDGQPIYLGEIRSRVEGIASVHGSLEESLGKDWQDDLLQNVVDDKIVEQQAAALGIDVTPAQIDTSIERLRGYFASEQEFQAWLTEGEMDEAELRDRIRLQDLATGVYLRVTDDVAVGADEARAWFAKHPEDYPGVDGEGVPFYAVKDEIEKDLLKDERDEAYAAWLEAQRGQVEVVIVMDAWWKEIA
jgi:hypothetical protein